MFKMILTGKVSRGERIRVVSVVIAVVIGVVVVVNGNDDVVSVVAVIVVELGWAQVITRSHFPFFKL